MTTTALLDNIIAEQLRPTYEAHVVAQNQARRDEIAEGHQVKKEEVAIANGDCKSCYKPFTGELTAEVIESLKDENLKIALVKRNEFFNNFSPMSFEKFKAGRTRSAQYDLEERICHCHKFPKAVTYLCEKFPTVKAYADYKLTLADIAYGEVRVNELIETMVTKITKKLKKKNIELETAELTSAWNIDNFTMKINGKHNVKVTVVDAGGYNIQCYHLRQLVHVK